MVPGVECHPVDSGQPVPVAVAIGSGPLLVAIGSTDHAGVAVPAVALPMVAAV
jgi:hypothetical protein